MSLHPGDRINITFKDDVPPRLPLEFTWSRGAVVDGPVHVAIGGMAPVLYYARGFVNERGEPSVKLLPMDRG